MPLVFSIPQKEPCPRINKANQHRRHGADKTIERLQVKRHRAQQATQARLIK